MTTPQTIPIESEAEWGELEEFIVTDPEDEHLAETTRPNRLKACFQANLVAIENTTTRKIHVHLSNDPNHLRLMEVGGGVSTTGVNGTVKYGYDPKTILQRRAVAAGETVVFDMKSSSAYLSVAIPIVAGGFTVLFENVLVKKQYKIKFVPSDEGNNLGHADAF